MPYRIGRDAAEGYVWIQEPTLNLGSSAPWRVVDNGPDHDPKYVPRPVGFAPTPREVDPLLWEGDDS